MPDAVIELEDLDDCDLAEPVRSRTITERDPAPQPIRGVRLELDLDDPECIASFLEAAARVVRERRRVVLTFG